MRERLRHIVFVALLFCGVSLWAPIGFAQVIEFEAPEEIVVDESRIVVTFVDTVDVDTARAIVREAGGRVSAETFRSVTVWALFDAPPDPQPLLALYRDPRPSRVIVYPPSASGGTWVTLDDGERVMADFSTHALRVDLAPSTSEEDAASVVHAYFPELVVRIERFPNELTVELPENGSAVATVIEENPLVKYITYFSITEQGVYE